MRSEVYVTKLYFELLSELRIMTTFKRIPGIRSILASCHFTCHKMVITSHMRKLLNFWYVFKR